VGHQLVFTIKRKNIYHSKGGEGLVTYQAGIGDKHPHMLGRVPPVHQVTVFRGALTSQARCETPLVNIGGKRLISGNHYFWEGNLNDPLSI